MGQEMHRPECPVLLYRPLPLWDGWACSAADDSHEFCVKANGGPLTITLVWADYPASPSGAAAAPIAAPMSLPLPTACRSSACR